MRRTASTNFEFGEIESVLTVVPGQGVGEIPSKTMDRLHTGIITYLMPQVISVLAWSIDTFELKADGETERHVKTSMSLVIEGYTCDFVINVVLNVKLASDYVKGIITQISGPKFATLAAQTIGYIITEEALQQTPSYREILLQKTPENHPLADYLKGPPDAGTPIGGLYL